MYELSRVRAKERAMKRSPSKVTAWLPVFQTVIELAALGLCTWAMTAARNRGRELPGGTTPPSVPPPAGA
jgi:hypothetical protein